MKNQLSTIEALKTVTKIKTKTEKVGPIIIKIGDNIVHDGTHQYHEMIGMISEILDHLSRRNF